MTISEAAPAEESPGGSGGGSNIITSNQNASSESGKEREEQDSAAGNGTDIQPDKATSQPEFEIQEISQEPRVEQPKAVISGIWKNNRSIYIPAIVLFILASIFVIIYTKPIKYNPQIEQYTIKALQLGYSYDAVRHILKQRFPEDIIDQHFHTLRRHNIKPLIRFHKPVEKEVSDKEAYKAQLRLYIENQRHNGFKDKHIKEVLLANGYVKSLVEEVFKKSQIL